jgi:hypothetical protein
VLALPTGVEQNSVTEQDRTDSPIFGAAKEGGAASDQQVRYLQCDVLRSGQNWFSSKRRLFLLT